MDGKALEGPLHADRIAALEARIERLAALAAAAPGTADERDAALALLDEIRREGLAEQQVRQREEHVRVLAETMLEAIGIYAAIRDARGQIIDFRIEHVNDTACALNGMSRES